MRQQPLSEEIYRGHKICTWYDQDAGSPRESDTLGTLILAHPRYYLANETNLIIREQEGLGEIYDALVKMGAAIIGRVVMHDHGGVCLRLVKCEAPHTPDWDTSIVGFIFVTHDRLISEYGAANAARKTKDMAWQRLADEVEEYGAYINGECIMYSIESPGGELLETVGTWIGDKAVESAINEAKAMVDHIIQACPPKTYYVCMCDRQLIDRSTRKSRRRHRIVIVCMRLEEAAIAFRKAHDNSDYEEVMLIAEPPPCWNQRLYARGVYEYKHRGDTVSVYNDESGARNWYEEDIC